MAAPLSLEQALEQAISDAQERIRTIRGELNKAAQKVSDQALAVANAETNQDAARAYMDPHEFGAIRAWQNRLDEAQQAYGTLSALRANYCVELRAASAPSLSPELQRAFDEEFAAGREALEYLKDR